MDLLSVEEQMRRWDADAARRGGEIRSDETGTAAAVFEPLTSVQLKDRTWIITNCDGKIDEVNGPGVIGDNPLLKAVGLCTLNQVDP
jgi:hypothetical protein